jgi:hypothetical protein
MLHQICWISWDCKWRNVEHILMEKLHAWKKYTEVEMPFEKILGTEPMQ